MCNNSFHLASQNTPSKSSISSSPQNNSNVPGSPLFNLQQQQNMNRGGGMVQYLAFAELQKLPYTFEKYNFSRKLYGQPCHHAAQFTAFQWPSFSIFSSKIFFSDSKI